MRLRLGITVGMVIGALALLILGVTSASARPGPVMAQSSSCAGQVSIHSLAPALPATFSGSTVRVSLQVRRLSAEAPKAVQLALEIRSPNDGVVYDSTSWGEDQIVDISGGGIHERYFDWPSSSGSATGAYSTLASVRNASKWDDVCDATWSGAWGGGYPR
mgnify:CR=1 FL=1